MDGAITSAIREAVFDCLSSVSGKPRSELLTRLQDLTAKFEPSFQRRAPFDIADLTNTRSFDFVAYTWWRLVADILPPGPRRKEFTAALGDRLLDIVARQDKDKDKGDILDGKKELLTTTRPEGFLPLLRGAKTALQVLGQAGLFTTFDLDLDDDAASDWDEGYSVELKVSVRQTATLGASLQLAGEGQAFRPDVSSLVLGSFFRRRQVTTGFDEYFLDETYRPDPNDFRPELLLQQWTLQRPATALAPPAQSP